MILIFNLFASILMQYFIIITCKNIMSYNEELFLWTTYIVLLMIILNLMPLFVKNYIIKESFSLIEFYENFFYLKAFLLLKIINFIKIISKKEVIESLLFKQYLIAFKNAKIFSNINKKKKIEIFFFLNTFLEKSLILKKKR